ncbi:hypothetical protein [Pararhizobium sp.]|uniref:hypothetical protein n=1 Tax=Pararhizobium sp. TaxID=1977563 RepID=UPI003D0CC3B9
MAVKSEIKTRFALDGITNAVAKLRAFQKSVTDTFVRVRERTAKAFEPMTKSLTALGEKAKIVGKELGKLGAHGGLKVLKTGALAATAAVALLALKVTAISAAAIRASKDTAAMLDKLGRDAKKLRMSTQDLSVLGFAADQNSIEKEGFVSGLADISDQFKEIGRSVDESSRKLQLWYTQGRAVRAFGKKNPGIDVSEMTDASTAEYSAAFGSSLAAVEAAMDRNAVAQNQTYALGDRRNSQQAQGLRDLSYVQVQQQLLDQRQAIIDGYGEVGKGLFDLRAYGLDFEAATKGGAEGLVAISEAFVRIEDPAQRSRTAVRLFGKEAGPGMIPVLEGGRKSIEAYRKELERLGGVATPADVAKATAYEVSQRNLKTAGQGLQLEISRSLLPVLTETNVEITDWVVASRVKIAEYVTSSFIAVKTFVTDIISLLQGDTTDIQTGWLDALIKKSVVVRDVWRDIKRQFKLLMSGQDSDYAWINKIRDGFLVVKAFAMDAFAVFTGGDAKEFKFMNGLRDQVVAFAGKVREAFEMFKSVLSGLHELIKPILNFFSLDITTFALFVGMLRLTGLLGVLKLAFMGVIGTAGKLFAFGGAATAAAAGAGAATGAATAGAAVGAVGLLGTLGRVISLLAAATRAAGVLGASLVAGFSLGKLAGEAFYSLTGAQKGWEDHFAMQTDAIRKQDGAYVNKLLARRDDEGVAVRNRLRESMGQVGGEVTAEDRKFKFRQKMDEQIWGVGNARYYGPDAAAQYRKDEEESAETAERRKVMFPIYKAEREAKEREEAERKAAVQQPSATFNYKIDINGKSATVSSGDTNMRAVMQELKLATQGFN